MSIAPPVVRDHAPNEIDIRIARGRHDHVGMHAGRRLGIGGVCRRRGRVLTMRIMVLRECRGDQSGRDDQRNCAKEAAVHLHSPVMSVIRCRADVPDVTDASTKLRHAAAT
ncbi:hypothetical protein [Paracoccus beibuensis]|uniref:hypothetical protein n=1 Tax=Paracoccus beibuensis TaxID=547602 RepID=UPI0038995D45